MMTESYTETIRGNVESPCDYPLLSTEFALSSIEGATAHEGASVINNLPSTGEYITLTDVEMIMAAGVNIS